MAFLVSYWVYQNLTDGAEHRELVIQFGRRYCYCPVPRPYC